jgi:hypothetical protein
VENRGTLALSPFAARGLFWVSALASAAGRSGHNVAMINSIRARLRANHRKNEQWRRDVEAMRLGNVQGLAGLSDEELIAKDPSIPSRSHQMEMQRRLKVAMTDLTAEAKKARIQAAWGTWVLIALTLALVALTVVLAVKA